MLYITMQTSMGNSKYLTCKVVRSISLEFGVCEMNDKKNACACKPVARICHWNSDESNETDEVNDAKMIVE